GEKKIAGEGDGAEPLPYKAAKRRLQERGRSRIPPLQGGEKKIAGEGDGAEPLPYKAEKTRR
ncbi:MAG: hypothetical protein IKU73_06200, partial [Clostridia bacterium]|nr:hypothetical protein [Clostridia bacterium]